MVMRVTENMKFGTAVTSLGDVQDKYNNVLEQMASQKKINRISDDPLGMTMLLGYRQGQAAIDQYQKNIDNSNGWLAMTESKLTSAGDLLTKAKELALSQGTATATAETRRIAAASVGQLKEEMLSLANSTYGDRYLFAGSRTGSGAPFSAAFQTASIDPPTAGSTNGFDGTIAANGAYAADANKTYVLKIIDGGALGTATYQISSDGGKTWGATQLTDGSTAPTTTISLPDGVSLTLTDSGLNHLTTGDMFSVHAYKAGYYRGNDNDLTTDIGREASIAYNITGQAAFAGGAGGVDVLKILDDLKTALLNNDQQGVLAQVDTLKKASDQMSFSQSKVGTTMNRIELAKSNLQDLSEQLTTLTSNTEDADITELITNQAKLQVILQASYITASKIGGNTILDFMK